MSSRRLAKVNEAIRETVASEILLRVRDPRVKSVTVLRADAAADLRTAKVYVSVMGDDKVQSLSMHGLRSAAGYLQSKIADRLQTRCTPVLTFILDPSVKVSLSMSAAIRDALASGVAPPVGLPDEEPDEDYEADEDGDDEYADEAESDEIGSEDSESGLTGATGPEDAGEVVPGRDVSRGNASGETVEKQAVAEGGESPSG
jgi:ribosome-binding factor A